MRIQVNTNATHPAEEAAVVRPSRPVIYSQRKLYRAMTDEQFATFNATKGQQSARKQAIYGADDKLDSTHPEFTGEFRPLMVAKFGEAETARLLGLAVA
jgi:hypothetical protein